MIKVARATYLSNLFSNSWHDPKILFDTISNIVSPTSHSVPISLVDECNTFFSSFVGKIRKNEQTSSPPLPPLPCPCRPTILESFSPNSVQELSNLFSYMKTLSCPFVILSTTLFKKYFAPLVHMCSLSIIHWHLVMSQLISNKLLFSNLSKEQIWTLPCPRTTGPLPSYLFS